MTEDELRRAVVHYKRERDSARAEVERLTAERDRLSAEAEKLGAVALAARALLTTEGHGSVSITDGPTRYFTTVDESALTDLRAALARLDEEAKP